jgi:hypothetical protein
MKISTIKRAYVAKQHWRVESRQGRVVTGGRKERQRLDDPGGQQTRPRLWGSCSISVFVHVWPRSGQWCTTIPHDARWPSAAGEAMGRHHPACFPG